MNFIRIIQNGTALTLSCFLYVSHAEAEQSSDKATDKSLVEKGDVLDRLDEKLRRTPSIRSQGIDATIKNGIVTLSGSVDSLSAARSASEIAGSIPDVNSVVNQIIVQPPVISDETIVEYAVSLISEFEAADASRIQITSNDGVVELSGRTDSLMEKQLVESEISFIRGVKSINNKLDINSRRDTNDEELKSIITALMENSAVLDGSNVEIEVENRSVSLSGIVLSRDEKTAAVELAGIPGVITVNADALTIGIDEDREKRRNERIAAITDKEIAGNIKLAMKQHPLLTGAAEGIEATSTGGLVTLTGKAKRFSVKKAAEKIATSTSGVQGVDNQIQVEWSDSKITDKEIVENVRKAVARDAYLVLADIIPRSRDYHVHLFGMVDTHFEKSRAGRIADAQPGVVHVANYLTVSDSLVEKSDEEIAKALRADIEFINTDPQVQVSVNVTNGVPVFRGNVSTWFQWQSLLRMAEEAGARRPHIDVAVFHRPSGVGSNLYVPQ